MNGNRPDLMVIDDMVDAKTDAELAKAFAAERIRRMDMVRLQEMQRRAQAHLVIKHRRQMRDEVKVLGIRQVKKLVKQARRDAKAAHPTAE